MLCNKYNNSDHSSLEVLQDLSALSVNDAYDYIIIGGDFNSTLVAPENKMVNGVCLSYKQANVSQ